LFPKMLQQQLRLRYIRSLEPKIACIGHNDTNSLQEILLLNGNSSGKIVDFRRGGAFLERVLWASFCAVIIFFNHFLDRGKYLIGVVVVCLSTKNQ